jgi:hypothetical protein
MIFAMVVFLVASTALVLVGLHDSDQKTESESSRKNTAA